jgi:hypothetical protein
MEGKMRNAMRLPLVCFTLFLLIAYPWAVRAQNALSLPSVEVDLWPEYDQPLMLVIYHITLPETLNLPAEISISIPEEAGSPSAVAIRQGGNLINAVYNMEAGEEWSKVRLTATSPQVQIEYYDPRLQKDGASRHFEYTWPGDYAVESLTIQVQRPAQATEMRISPSLGSGVTGQDGLTYYTAEVGSLSGGQTFTIALDYEKETDDLSVAAVDLEPSLPVTENTAGRMTISSTLPWILGLLGLLLIVGGGIWYWRSGQEQPQSRPRPRRRGSKVEAEAKPPAAEGDYLYCPNCGKRASPGDRFCRTCGNQLR